MSTHPQPSKPHHRRLVAGALALVALLALVLASCSSEPVAEEPIGTAADALTPGKNNPPCGATCPTGQVFTCGNQCVTPVAIGSACSITDCATNSQCVAGASCVHEGGVYRCRATSGTGLGALELCSPTDDQCAPGLYCKDFDTCSPGGVTYGTRCAFGVHHDFPCDSSWTSPLCAPCMPGTTCVNGYCHDDCTNASQCPCEDSGASMGCTGGKCYECQSLGQGCGAESMCCDANTHCGGAASKCCKNIGQACTSQSDCCLTNGDSSSEVCLSGTNVCGLCKPNGTGAGSSCGANTDCCNGECVSGKCTASCAGDVGEDCQVAGQQGLCRHSTYTCNLFTGVRSCLQTYFASGHPELCNANMEDEDCDGHVDEGTFGACNYTNVANDECQSGFVVAGSYVCVNGETKCEQDVSTICTICGGTCGGCSAQPNCGGTACPPNETCVNDNCVPNPSCDGDPTPPCWNPSQIGTCVNWQ